jgi:AcrR family transcriptional regulator
MAATRRELEREQRRRHLLEAAERVFGRKPFDVATMQDVASEAQIGMQGLYEHFASKDDLYAQVVATRVESLRRRVDEVLKGERDPLRALRGLARVYMEVFETSPMFLPVFLMERARFDWEMESRLDAGVRALYREERARVARVLRKIRAQGRLGPFPVEYMTQHCMDTIHAALWYRHRCKPSEEIETCVNRAFQALFSGLSPAP